MYKLARCSTCYLPNEQCMCDLIKTMTCPMEICVIRHAREAKRNSNTGRLVVASIESAKLIPYGYQNQPLPQDLLTTGDTWLLYPKPGASVPTALPNRLIVLDASWPQARRMSQRIPGLHKLQTLALPSMVPVVLPRMRKEKQAAHMSTAESVITALQVLGQEKVSGHLRELYVELVRRFALPQRKGPR